MLTSIKYLSASVLTSLAFSMSANAASMTWQAPVTITADTDVVTTGTLLGAYIPGANALGTTVNGVSFTPVFVAQAYDDTTTTSLTFGSVATLAGNLGLYGGQQYETGIPSGLSSAYTKVFSGAVGPATNSLSFILTLTNLTIGHEYLFQNWVNESRVGFASIENRTETLTSGGNTSGSLAYNVDKTEGSRGSFVVGTFTADETTQDITYNASQFAQISAFQLRVTAVPEPSTYIGGGLILGLAAWSQRKRFASRKDKISAKLLS